MAEANPTFSASTLSTPNKGPLGNNMLSALEA